VDGRPPCVNDDIAIQWQWSNFDPSQNPNPFTDYDNTLHNWLRPRDERVTQNLCQSAVRVRLGKYVKYNTKIFFPDSPTEVTLGRIFTHNDSNYAQSRKEVPFWGLHDGRPHLRGQIPPKPATNRQKIGHFVREVNDDEEWRHRRMTSMTRCSLALL